MTTSTTNNQRKYQSGAVFATRGASEHLDPVDVMKALARHFMRDWGECCPEDWNANDEALREGGRVCSVYRDRHGTRFWIITEGDRSATTVLLPDEY